MSVLILNKSISRSQWVALGLLTAGVALVQISSMPSSKVRATHCGSSALCTRYSARQEPIDAAARFGLFNSPLRQGCHGFSAPA